MKLKDIKLKTCPFCDGEGVLIHSKPDDGYIYSEGVHAFVKCKECDACGPILNYYRAEKCQLKHIEQMLRGIATRDMTPL